MSKAREIRFTIDAYSPETLPMKRLAEYLTDLATLLGDSNNVHLVGIEQGSAVFVNKVDEIAEERIKIRIQNIKRGKGPIVALNAFREINNRLSADSAKGSLSEPDGAEIIAFPGRDTPKQKSYGPFAQEGSLDGKVIMVGGVGEAVPVHVQQGTDTFNCYSSREIAKELGRFLFTTEIRVYGTGRWIIDENENWELKRFNISRFEVLDNVKLREVIQRLRNIENSGIAELEDPWQKLSELRQDRIREG